jgi:hypothetical protein
MSWSASVAEVVSRVTMGFRVIMAETGVFLGSRDSAVTYGRDRARELSLSSNSRN